MIFILLICLMLFSVNIFISTEDGIAEKLVLFKIKLIVIFNLLVLCYYQ